MIFAFLFSLPALLLSAILSILPEGGTIPTIWTNAVYTIWSYINAFSFIVPVDTLLTCLGIAMVFHIAIFTFRLFHWLITKIPFIG